MMLLPMSSKNSHTLPGSDDITRQELPNGIVLLCRANFNSPSIVIKGYLLAGGIYDSDEKLGLADFTAAALMRGTKSHDFQEIYDVLESAGASLGIGCATHTVTFHGKALTEDLGSLIALLAESLQYPTFPEKQVERLRTQMLTALAIRSQDTSSMATLAFDQIVYQDHPYQRPEDGYPETIEAILRQDLVDFHKMHYGPQGMVITVVGGISPDEALDQVAEVFTGWISPRQVQPAELPPLKPLLETTRQDVDIPDKAQADIVIGAAGPPRRATEFFAAALANSILGQFGMMGRIGTLLREDTGLAYYAGSSLSGGVGPGPWSVSAAIAPQNVDQAVDLVTQEIKRFTSEPVSDEELTDSQANFIGRLPLSMESNAGVATALTNLERYDLGLDHYHHFTDLVMAVTPADVLEVARRYLDPQRLAIAVAGSRNELQK